MHDLRSSAAEVARRATHVQIQEDVLTAYAATLATAHAPEEIEPDRLSDAPREMLTAFWLTMDAINFGSGWFPTLHKANGRSGYYTISSALRAQFNTRGPWSAQQLAALDPGTIADVLGQDPDHELMDLFAASLNDLGRQVAAGDGSFAGIVDGVRGSATRLARTLGGWPCFADTSRYDELELPFLKRAQIAAADLHRAGAARFTDRDRLTMFADNLVPHVLRQDGVLWFEPGLVARIEAGELITHDSAEEIEIRACAVHAVELIAGANPGTCAADIDQLLWLRGQQPAYKASPRHRARCTAY